jgi:hypothetical protein
MSMTCRGNPTRNRPRAAMTYAETAAEFLKLPPTKKATFLLHLAHALTVRARGAYVPQGPGGYDGARLRAINELQHKVIGHLVYLDDANRSGYPDDVLVRMLEELAEGANAEEDLRIAGEQAMRAVHGPPLSATP